MNGSQAQLEFLPERSTDFIFAVIGEEFGLLGLVILLLLYLFVVGRALYLAMQTQDTFARLLARSLALTFFVYVFINAGMVSGLAAGRRCTASSRQLRRHFDGDPAGGLRYSHVPVLTPETRWLVACSVVFYSSLAVAVALLPARADSTAQPAAHRASISTRPEIKTFIDDVAKRQLAETRATLRSSSPRRSRSRRSSS